MPNTSFPDGVLYSEHNTMTSDLYRLLQQQVTPRSEQEVMDLVDHCLEVFLACDLQLPSYLAKRLNKCGVGLVDFFEFAIEMVFVPHSPFTRTTH